MRAGQRSAGAAGSGRGAVRIIAGRWRGRRLPVPAVTGLRPTPDRVRETLFNWLAPVLPGSRCLDLFAGTGVLGFEALSRGAAACTFVERSRAQVRVLRAAGAALGVADCEVVEADGLRWIAGCTRRFDLVFLDPPFGSGLLEAACEALVTGHRLQARGLVYVEGPAGEALPTPPGFVVHRQARAGRVSFGLLANAADR